MARSNNSYFTRESWNSNHYFFEQLIERDQWLIQGNGVEASFSIRPRIQAPD